jgi:hypothetical protein
MGEFELEYFNPILEKCNEVSLPPKKSSKKIYRMTMGNSYGGSLVVRFEFDEKSSFVEVKDSLSKQFPRGLKIQVDSAIVLKVNQYIHDAKLDKKEIVIIDTNQVDASLCLLEILNGNQYNAIVRNYTNGDYSLEKIFKYFFNIGKNVTEQYNAGISHDKITFPVDP